VVSSSEARAVASALGGVSRFMVYLPFEGGVGESRLNSDLRTPKTPLLGNVFPKQK
jgi:hypothetical protein